jgi:hypothetical protein
MSEDKVADPYLLHVDPDPDPDPDPVFSNILDPDLGFKNAIFSTKTFRIIISSNNKCKKDHCLRCIFILFCNVTDPDFYPYKSRIPDLGSRN